MIQILLFAILLIAFIYWIKIHSVHSPRKGYLKPDEVSLPLKVINAISDASVATFGYTPIQVNRKKIIKMAEEVAAITDETIFGKQDEFLNSVSLFVNGLKQEQFSASGTILLNGFLQNTIRTRRRVVEYINSHPEVLLNSKFEEPFVISGLPRTGSTLLYNLMACDSKSRSPRFYEMSACVNIMPPILAKEQSKTHPRIHEAVKRFELIEKMYPNYFKEANKSHYIHPAEIEEDILVMYQSYVLQSHWPLSGKEFREWYEDDTNKESVYKFHQRFFQLLSYYWNPESHWLLKAPVHSTYLKALYNQYPKAKMIITHRDPNSVVPSWIRLNEAYINWNYNDYQLNRAEFGKDLNDSLVLCAKRIMEFTSFIDQKCEKENVANDVYINVIYEDLMKDPVGTVRNIYNFFNVPFTDEFKENMEKYLNENQQGKHGRREYSLDDYSLSTQQIQKDFKEYISFFNVPVK